MHPLKRVDPLYRRIADNRRIYLDRYFGWQEIGWWIRFLPLRVAKKYVWYKEGAYEVTVN